MCLVLCYSCLAACQIIMASCKTTDKGLWEVIMTRYSSYVNGSVLREKGSGRVGSEGWDSPCSHWSAYLTGQDWFLIVIHYILPRSSIASYQNRLCMKGLVSWIMLWSVKWGLVHTTENLVVNETSFSSMSFLSGLSRILSSFLCIHTVKTKSRCSQTRWRIIRTTTL